jgi:ATP-dependent helicase HrpB
MRLPIDDFLPRITESLKSHPNLIISASPGAGKTTRVPVELSRHFIKQTDKKQIWVLEPRRIAAISAAHRIAEEQGWRVGEEVGYQVRFESQSSSSTRILFLTEALLLRKLRSDPELLSVDAIVLDEFHERSVHVDLALASLKELQELSRPDLKIIVMSATLNALRISEFLDAAPVIDVPGKSHALQVVYHDKAQILRTGPELIQRMKELVIKAVQKIPQGDVLVFLPGQKEIKKLSLELTSVLPEAYSVFELHGQLALAEQRRVLQPCAGRKIILATNVAESSITIDGVSIVVDSGLARIQEQDLATGFDTLRVTKISKASATQRAGRAARQGPGVVFRAWSQYEESTQKDFETPEIERVDLAESLLILSGLGISNFDAFSWFQKPNDKRLQMSLDFLVSINALTHEYQITDDGKKLGSFPVHPRLGKLLLEGQKRNLFSLACKLAVFLSEKSRSKQPLAFSENDLWITDFSSQNEQRMYNQLLALSKDVKSHKNEEGFASQQELLFAVYNDRLCRRRQTESPEAKMAGGRGVQLHTQSTVRKSLYFLALEIKDGTHGANSTVFSAFGLDTQFVESQLKSKSEAVRVITWDEKAQKFWLQEERQWRGLSLGAASRKPATSEDVREKLVDVVLERWEMLLEKNQSLAQFLQRVDFLSKTRPEFLPFSKEMIRASLEQACYGETSLEKVFEKDLIYFFKNNADPKQMELLERECPSHWVVPTGNRLRVKYSVEQGPSVEVRLQELFGLNQAPIFCGQSLTLFLLAPNYRPVQVTRDLASFWKNGYPEVRKEMRTRYPKHSWPDDPLTAPPQAKGRPRQ